MNYFFTFLVGLICGRFFYELSMMFIEGSFSKDRFNVLSNFIKCRGCGHCLNFLYMVPIIGYFLVRGKCSNCGKKFTKDLPFTEILIGILAIITLIKLGLSFYSVIIFLIICVSISISIIDAKTFKIPNSLVISIIILSAYPVIFNNSLLNNLYGFLLMAVIFLIILLVFPGSFGGGDLKYAAAIGLLLGLELSVVALEISLVTGSVTGIIYVIKSGKGFKIKIPFAPFLTSGLLISLLWGRDILYTYFRLVY